MESKTRYIAKNYDCPLCKYTTKDESQMKSHLGDHNEERMFRCKNCSHVAKTKFDLKFHILKSHQKNYELTSNTMESQNKSNGHFSNNLRIDQSKIDLGNLSSTFLYTCSKCEFVSKHRKLFSNHLAFHKDNDNHKCNLCQFKSDVIGLHNHIMIKHIGN